MMKRTSLEDDEPAMKRRKTRGDKLKRRATVNGV